MTLELASAISRIAKVVMFENWLRFYFIAEEGETLVLRLPEKALQRLKESYPQYHELAEHLNNREIDHQTSMREVCLFVSGSFNDAPLPEGVLALVFDSKEFQMELQLFSYWVQAHEEQLDAAFLEFAEWLKAFDAWKNSDDVREKARHLSAGLDFDRADAPETIQ